MASIKYIPVRAIIWVMCFTCTLFLYMLRINLSIIILAMVEPNTKGNSANIPECLVIENYTAKDNILTQASHSVAPNYGTRYAWSNELQGTILGSYFYGFFVTGIPGGALAEKYGPRKCITISFLVSGLLTLISPWVAEIHPWLLIGSRFLVGLFGGVVFPSLHCLVARWAPPHEKGKFIGGLLGGLLGTVITWPLLAAVIENLGWVWAFVGSGILVIAWTAMWFFCVSDSPEQHPRISDEEKNYIINSLSGKISKQKRLPPYKDILLTIPFWALLILHFGTAWGLFFLLTAGPKFMSTVLGFTMGHTGLVASLPPLARLILGIVFGQIGDLITRKNWMSKTFIRKTFVLFSHILPGLLLYSQTLVGCNVTWAIVLITLSLGLNGASTITNLQNSQDLSPNFAGTVYGIINCAGSITGFVNPAIVGYMTSEKNGMDEWHTIFYIGSSVYIVCGIVFCIFGTGETQSWNDKEKSTSNNLDGIENINFEEIKSNENI